MKKGGNEFEVEQEEIYAKQKRKEKDGRNINYITISKIRKITI